jgi:hypothetical protein
MSAMSALSAIGAPRAPPLPRSTPKNKDLAVSTPGLTSGFLRFPDVPNHQISKARSARHTPHPAISIVYCKQKTSHQSTLAPPLRHAWVILGPRLGHPRATQTQSQSAEGRNPPLPLPPMSTQFDPRSPNVTQGFGVALPNTRSLFCWQLLLSKTVHGTTFSLWSESQNLPFVRLFSQEKRVERRWKNGPL